MKPTRRDILALGAAAAAFRAEAAQPPLVFAASSLKTVLDELSRQFPMRLSYGGSGALARQILLGAPAELYFSAQYDWMVKVHEAGLLQKSPSQKSDQAGVGVMSNSIVLIGQPGQQLTSLNALPGAGRIGMGYVNAVPAGQYGKSALKALGLWDKVANQIVETDNVRAVLALVARGELPFGVVYATDALAEPNVQVIAQFDPATHAPVTYDLGLLKGASAAAEDLFDALRGPQAKAVYAKHGFEVF